MVYERLPLEIGRYILNLPTAKDTQTASLTVLLRSLPLGILRTCRHIHDEADKMIQRRVEQEILDHPPKVIYTVSVFGGPSIVRYLLLSSVRISKT
jgi:hypothetical protein